MVELDLDLWLTPEDIKGETVVYFSDEGERGVISKPEGVDDIEVFNITVKMPDGSKKIWTMNKTSQRAVAKSYGTGTALWIDRPVTLFATTQNVMGSMKQVIYAKAPETQPPTTTETVV